MSHSTGRLTDSPTVFVTNPDCDCRAHRLTLLRGWPVSEHGQAQTSARVTIRAYCTMMSPRESINCRSNVHRTVLQSRVPASPPACHRAFPEWRCGSSPLLTPHHACITNSGPLRAAPLLAVLAQPLGGLGQMGSVRLQVVSLCLRRLGVSPNREISGFARRAQVVRASCV